jgi:hypothetical protein
MNPPGSQIVPGTSISAVCRQQAPVAVASCGCVLQGVFGYDYSGHGGSRHFSGPPRRTLSMKAAKHRMVAKAGFEPATFGVCGRALTYLTDFFGTDSDAEVRKSTLWDTLLGVYWERIWNVGFYTQWSLEDDGPRGHFQFPNWKYMAYN